MQAVIVRVLGTFLMVACATQGRAQNLILNGDFEDNTSSGCDFNNSDSSFNAKMANVTSFGVSGELDIMEGDCGFGLPPQSGTTKVGIATPDALSFTLSAPVVSGQMYDLSFYAVDTFYGGEGPPTLQIGVSSSSASSGSAVFSTAVANTASWVQYGTTFTAPLTGSYLTISLSAPRWAHIDNFCLATAGGDCPVPPPPTAPLIDTPTATPTPTSTEAPTSTPTPIGACPGTADPGCLTGFTKGLLLVRDTLGKEKVVAKWIKGPMLAQADMGNPLVGGSGTVFSLCLYDQSQNLAGQLRVDRAAGTCAGKPCWTSIGKPPPDPAGKGYKYSDKTRTTDGVQSIVVKAGEAGKPRAVVKGKGANLPSGIPALLQSSAQVTIQLRASDGACLSHTMAHVVKSASDYYKVR